MALLHIHGEKCLLHEAKTVTKNVKYVFRSDVVFAWYRGIFLPIEFVSVHRNDYLFFFHWKKLYTFAVLLLCLPLISLSCGSFKIRYRVSYLRALLKFYFVMSWIDLQLISSETLCRVYRQNMMTNLSPGYKWGDQHSFKDSRYLLDSNKLLHTGVDSLSSCYC